MSERLTQAAVAEINKMRGLEDERPGSPIIDAIIIFAPIIIDLIKGCFDDPEKAAWRARNPGLGGRLRLRREAAERFPGDDADSKEAREVFFNAMIAAGKKATAEDFKTVGAAA